MTKDESHTKKQAKEITREQMNEDLLESLEAVKGLETGDVASKSKTRREQTLEE